MTGERLKAKWLREDEEQIDAAVGALLQHPGGRRFLWWCLQIGRVGTQPFGGNALQTAFACGELNVGQQFLDRITSVSPEGYVTMMKEKADERRTRDSILRDASNGGADYDTGDEDTGVSGTGY